MTERLFAWRCRLLSSTVSLSEMASSPTPAAARYSAAEEPRPPAPTSSTRAQQRALRAGAELRQRQVARVALDGAGVQAVGVSAVPGQHAAGDDGRAEAAGVAGGGAAAARGARGEAGLLFLFLFIYLLFLLCLGRGAGGDARLRGRRMAIFACIC